VPIISELCTTSSKIFMRKVIGIGETGLDIIFRNEQPIAAVPGGSTFNALISLGRSGISCNFISEIGNDRVGMTIKHFLQDNGVNINNISSFPDSKSSVSLAFLDEQNDAEYIFYKNQPHDQLDFSFPEIAPDDIVIFGSFYAVNPKVHQQVMALLEHARNKGAIIYYDVNYRSSHRNEVMKITPNLIDNLEYADIVRGSREDFEVVYKKDNPDTVYKAEIAFYCKDFIYTNGAENIVLRGKNDFKKEYPVVQTHTVSTIGAGDNFNAGFIFGLIKNHITRQMISNGLTEAQWDDLMHYATKFSANCCEDIYNYISKDFGAQMNLTLNK